MQEEIMRFGPQASIVGVFTRPSREPAADLAVILLDAGLIHHVGPSRLHVRIARAAAAQGLGALRFDFSGVGDSPARPDNLPIFQMVVAEPREAMDALAAFGYRRFVLLGICSGAYSAFKVACADPRVVLAVLINFQDVATAGSSGEATAWAKRYWSRSLFSPRAWRNLLTGRVDYARLGRTLSAQLTGRTREDPDSPLAQTRAELRALLERRGTRVVFLVSGADLSRDYVAALIGSRGVPEGASVETLEQADHLFTRRSDQDRLLERVLALLQATLR